MIFFGILLISIFLSLVIQEFIPPLPWLHGARVFLLPIILFYAALALPFGAMLVVAFTTGFLWDAFTTQIVDANVEISLGWSIILYATLGAIMSGFRPLFQRGRWEIHCLLSGVCTSFIVLSEYLMITFRRGGFVFTPDIWWRIGGPGLVAVLLSPILFFMLNRIARTTGYDPQPDRRRAR